jgi:predicted DNA-binding transcriptional regulator AlpA
MPADGSSADRPSQTSEEMLTAAETAKVLKVSESWLAKARMRGEGPPFIRLGRSVRYVGLQQWLKTK